MVESLWVGGEEAAMITPERLSDTERMMRETEDGGCVEASLHSGLLSRPGL